MRNTDAAHVSQLMERVAVQLEELRTRLEEVDQTVHIDLKISASSVEVIRVDDLPPVLEHVFRESVNNLRIALDRTVAYLARENAPTGYRHRGAFPIALTPESYHKRVMKEQVLKNVPPEAGGLIESVQPYHSDDPETHPLALLAGLSNEDKHGYGQPAWGMITALGIATVPDDGGAIEAYELIRRSEPIGKRRSLQVGDNLLAEFHPRVFEPFAAYLSEDDPAPGKLIGLARSSVGFGPSMLRWPELRNLHTYVNAEIVAPLTATDPL